MARADIFEVEHKTKVLPLRWFGNGCEYIAHYFLDKYLHWNYMGKSNFRSKTWSWIADQFYKPYLKWGTVYAMNTNVLSQLLEDTSGAAWEDYNEDGIPYWHYLWHEDPETGDAWRLVGKWNATAIN